MIRAIFLLCGFLVAPRYGLDDFPATLSFIPYRVEGIEGEGLMYTTLCRALVKKICEPRDYSGLSGQIREWHDKLVNNDNVCETPETEVCKTVETSLQPLVPTLSALSEWYSKRNDTNGTLCIPSDWLMFDDKCGGGNNQRCFNGTFKVDDLQGTKSFSLAKQGSFFDDECISEPLSEFHAYIYPLIAANLYEEDGSVRVLISIGSKQIPFGDVRKPFYSVTGDRSALAIFPTPEFKITKYEIRVTCYCDLAHKNPICSLPKDAPHLANTWLEMNKNGSTSTRNLHLKVHQRLPECEK